VIAAEPQTALLGHIGGSDNDEGSDSIGLSELRTDVLAHLNRIGVVDADGIRDSPIAKEAIRTSHAIQRAHLVAREYRAFGTLWVTDAYQRRCALAGRAHAAGLGVVSLLADP
jgi:hypothetical protein